MRERNGVSIGQGVVDLDGTSLGRVVALYAWGFKARRGLPILSRREHVIRYDEVRGVRDGALLVSRSRRDLFDLAAGEVPRSWRIPTPPAFPAIATPSEARYLLEDVARGRVPGAQPDADRASPEVPPAEVAPVSDAEVRDFADRRGEALAPEQSDRR